MIWISEYVYFTVFSIPDSWASMEHSVTHSEKIVKVDLMLVNNFSLLKKKRLADVFYLYKCMESSFPTRRNFSKIEPVLFVFTSMLLGL